MASEKNFKRTKMSCYFTYLAMASVFALPPILFVTFREMYGVSYTLLGTLVLVNFITQLTIDLIFTFFTKHFNLKLTLRIMPLLTSVGMFVYALVPLLAPGHAYVGLVIGTVIFSVSAGLCEVLLSPTVAAVPSKTPDRDMSMLHSLYGWGVVGVVIIGTLFLQLFGRENWMYLTMILAVLPLIAFAMFCASPMPEMDLTQEKENGENARKRTIGLALCVACIFLGSCAENAMTNWVSSFVENALHIPKVWGDIFGLALFALLLSIVRTLYGKYGKNISLVLLVSMIGAVCCYVAAGLVSNAIAGLAACVLTGIFTSMLWPGTLILMEEVVPHPGVAAYALMASGGDFGASVAPQLQGIVNDAAAASGWAEKLSGKLSLTTEQIGMKTGMLVSALFPFLGVFLLIFMRKYFGLTKKK